MKIKSRLAVRRQKLDDGGRRVKRRVLAGPLVTVAVHLDMPHQALAAGALPRDVVHAAREIGRARAGAPVPPGPPGDPLGNCGDAAAAGIPAVVGDGAVARPVQLHDGQGRAGRAAVVVARDVGVKGSRDGRKGGELPAVLGRAGQRPGQPGAVGVAGGVDARFVDAVVLLDTIDQVRGEDLVADALFGITRALPVFLHDKSAKSRYTIIDACPYLDSRGIHGNHVWVDALVREACLVLKVLRIVARAVIRNQQRLGLVDIVV